MLVSFVLRLSPDALASGLLVGEIEAVHTNERSVVHGVEELLAFCRARCRDGSVGPTRGGEQS